jgi:hypothetical protein
MIKPSLKLLLGRYLWLEFSRSSFATVRSRWVGWVLKSQYWLKGQGADEGGKSMRSRSSKKTKRPINLNHGLCDLIQLETNWVPHRTRARVTRRYFAKGGLIMKSSAQGTLQDFYCRNLVGPPAENEKAATRARRDTFCGKICAELDYFFSIFFRV